jgi:hypothetical protein
MSPCATLVLRHNSARRLQIQAQRFRSVALHPLFPCAPTRRQRELEPAYALKDVEYLLDLCREVELRARWLTRKEGISLGEQIRPDLVAQLESLVRTLRRS